MKPEFWSDEKLGPESAATRLVFLGLIGMADDGGRLLDSIKVIDAFVFPYTDETAHASLDRLAELGRIERGRTASGQRIIQIVNWSRHQKIEKPNLKAAFPPITVADASPRPRRKLPDAVVAQVWALAEGRCAACGVTCINRKRDQYDSRPELGEVDHIIELADGGSNEVENLQLLCLGCNRRKSGGAKSARNRRLIAEASPIDRRTISTIYDQDQRSRSGSTRPKGEPSVLFLDAWAAYPKRPNNSRADAWKAWQARVGEGADEAAMLAGAQAYAAYCAREGTEPRFIKQAATFFGPGKHYASDYGPAEPAAIAPYLSEQDANDGRINPAFAEAFDRAGAKARNLMSPGARR